ncbi:ABC transporter permease [Limosilactobacillus sp.]|uniref:ABC transporter permease n=1 Tax=Limosilactobacillus sp. TaxID=2773925 RepID=UPI0035A02635
MMQFLNQHGTALLIKTWEQIYISFSALLLGIIVAVPVGIAILRYPKTAKVVIGVANVLQTVPSLALLALMIPIFGIGQLPAIVALFLYSLLPILRNTYIGMKNVSPDLLDSAKGMGMTRRQIIWIVQLPQALPVIMAGIRLSAVYMIAWATLASYIGAGGLGDFIFNGLSLYEPELIIGGTIPVTILALLTDWGLRALEKRLTPINLRK